MTKRLFVVKISKTTKTVSFTVNKYNRTKTKRIGEKGDVKKVNHKRRFY